MTCRHVLGLIDTSPFVDYPDAELEAAWRHARQCATCGPALAASSALTADLAALDAPVPPPHVTEAVLARIARMPGDGRTDAAVHLNARRHRRDWSTWATLGGLAAGLAIFLIPYATALEVTPPAGRLSVAPLDVGLIHIVSLGLYVGGLFAPLARIVRREGSSPQPE